MRNRFIKKLATVTGSAILIGMLSVTPARADDSAALAIIAQNTTSILTDVTNIPEYVTTMVQYAMNMTATDTSQSTQTMQSNFATIGAAIATNSASQLALQANFNADLLAGATSATLPFGNDLIYTSLYGMYVFNPDPRNNQKNGAQPVNAAYNYIKIASGMKLPHAIPQPSWKGSAYDNARYGGYYATVTAAESFNAYILSQQMLDAQNSGLTAAQNALITQASSSDWIATIASEAIGAVLRQLLMFTSQNYVLMSQLLQVQKQQLAAQAMTNTLLIVNSQANEGTLLAKAQSSSPH